MFVQLLLQWNSNKYYIFGVCVCSLRYPACNVPAPYCRLYPDPLYNIFPHFLINSTIFQKRYWTYIMFLLPLQLLYAIFFILRRFERDVIKNVYRSSCQVLVILVRFQNLNFFFFFFIEKYSYIKFYEYPKNEVIYWAALFRGFVAYRPKPDLCSWNVFLPQ
jgi:hypothetical protein